MIRTCADSFGVVNLQFGQNEQDVIQAKSKHGINIRKIANIDNFNDIESLIYNIKKFNNKIAAVVLEPDGLVAPDISFLKELKIELSQN